MKREWPFSYSYCSSRLFGPRRKQKKIWVKISNISCLYNRVQYFSEHYCNILWDFYGFSYFLNKIWNYSTRNLYPRQLERDWSCNWKFTLWRNLILLYFTHNWKVFKTPPFQIIFFYRTQVLYSRHTKDFHLSREKKTLKNLVQL